MALITEKDRRFKQRQHESMVAAKLNDIHWQSKEELRDILRRAVANTAALPSQNADAP